MPKFLEGMRLARDGGEVTLRRATEDDAALMFEWQSDDRTRKFARNPNKPSWEGHVAWLRRYIESSGVLFIIQHKKMDAGILRLDPEGNGDHEVTVIIAPKFYRVGAAVPALRVARNQFTFGNFLAEVLHGNEASRRMLIEAGYKNLDDDHYIMRSYREDA